MAWVLLQKLPFDVILYINTHLLEIKQKEKMLIIDRKKLWIIYNESSPRISYNYQSDYNYKYYPPQTSSLTSLSSYTDYETDYESDYERKKDKLNYQKLFLVIVYILNFQNKRCIKKTSLTKL